jgi:protein-S-isoprenylcysteine O-methyltransferase Ste14
MKGTIGKQIHYALAHSYLVYFGSLMVGVFLNFLYPLGFPAHTGEWFGSSVIALASLLIFWAQMSSDQSDDIRREKGMSDESVFARGPYRYLRSPTHVGLLFLIIGFGLLVNSVWIVVMTLVAYLVAHRTFLKKEQEFLVKKYGEAYEKYRAKVRL